MQQQQELYDYLSNGPPDKPAFDAEADASEAVAQLLQGDLVVTTYDVLQQVGLSECCSRWVCQNTRDCICGCFIVCAGYAYATGLGLCSARARPFPGSLPRCWAARSVGQHENTTCNLLHSTIKKLSCSFELRLRHRRELNPGLLRDRQGY
jgi:hypothetical protein